MLVGRWYVNDALLVCYHPAHSSSSTCAPLDQCSQMTCIALYWLMIHLFGEQAIFSTKRLNHSVGNAQRVNHQVMDVMIAMIVILGYLMKMAIVRPRPQQ
jgi:hypothetical protein